MIMSKFPYYGFGTEDEGGSGLEEDPDLLRIFELPDLHPKIPVAEAIDEATTAAGAGPGGFGGWESEFHALGLCLDGFPGNGSACNATDYFAGGASTGDNGTDSAAAASAAAEFTLWHVVVFGILAGCTSVVTVVGNLIVILSFIIDRSIRQPTNYFIASLAVSDLLIGSISMPFYTIYLLAGKKWMLGTVLCDLWLSIDYTVCLSSIYTVFCITIDRFCSVIIPAKYRDWRTERRVLGMIGGTWVVPSLLFFISIFGWQYFVGTRTVPDSMCYVQYLENPVFSCLLQVGYFWITLIVMCVLYTGIYRVALKLAQRSEEKHKKMTSLVSVAGRTVTRIGVGVTQNQTMVSAVGSNKDPGDRSPTRDGTGKDRKKPETGRKNDEGAGAGTDVRVPSNALNNRTVAAVGGKADEGSSSTGYPSDTDPGSSQSAVSSHRRNGDTTKAGHHQHNAASSSAADVVPKLQPPPSGKITKETPTTTTAKTKEQAARSTTQGHGGGRGGGGGGGTQISCRAEITQRSNSITPKTVDVRRPDDVAAVTSGEKNASGEKKDGADDDCVLSFPSPTTHRRRLDTTGDLEPETDGEIRSNDLDPTAANELSKTDSVSGHQKSSKQPRHHINLNYFRRGRQAARDRGAGGKSRDKSSSKPKTTGRQHGPPAKTKGSAAASKSENRAKKALRTISVILGAFVLCWTPWHVLSMVIGFYNTEGSYGFDLLYDISYWLCYLNSPINPFCYALANQQFKKTFSRILKFDWHRT